MAAACAPAASAHSVLIATDPGNDVVVPESPDQVRLRFNDRVDATLGSVRVLDGEGTDVDNGNVSQPEPEVVAVGIDATLAPGTYTVAWRVVSADSDPISGAYVFHVQQRGVGASISLESLTGTPASVDALFTAARFFDLGLLLLVVGGSAVLVVAFPSAAWPLRRRLYGLLGSWAGALALVALANILLQGAAAGGLSLADAFSWKLFRAVLETDYGEVLILQSALAATLGLTALALRNAGRRDREPLAALTLTLAAALSLTPSFSGHARTLGGLGLASDISHVVSAALWTGGLGFLVLGLVLAEADRWPLATRAVPRFSAMAVGSVVVLLITGGTSAYLQLRTWSALWDNEYGLLVLAKIVLVLPLLALGAYNNRYAVPRLEAGVASVLERRRFLRVAGTELVIMAAIVAVTAVLVNAQPARLLELHTAAETLPAAPAPLPFQGTVALGDLEAAVTVDPAAAGENTITIAFTGAAGAEGVTEVKVAASLPSRSIGPLEFTADPDPARTGTYVVDEASLSIGGDWDLRIEALRGQSDLLTESITVPVAED